MTSLLVVILVIAVPVSAFLAYWSGKQDGLQEEFARHQEYASLQREKMLRLNLENEKLRRDRDGYADEIARFWSAANQKDGDYIE